MRHRTTIALVVFACACLGVAAQQAPLPSPQGRPGGVDARAAADAKGTASIRGRVVAADTGRPLVGVSMTAVSDAVRRQATTDRAGVFGWNDLPAGQYRVTVNMVTGYLPVAFHGDPETGGGEDITITDGESFDKADFRLLRGGVIAGRIVDEAGEPIEGVQVQALSVQYAAGLERLTPVEGGTSRSKRTDDLGRYRVFGLPPGEYHVAATAGAFNGSASNADLATGYAVTYYPGTPDPAVGERVKVSAAQETPGVDFALVPARAFELSGRVVDASGTPAVATVVMMPGASGTIGITSMKLAGADGVFTFTGVTPGKYVLQTLPAPPPPPGASLQPGSGMTFASQVVSVAGDTRNVLVQGKAPCAVTGTFEFEGAQPAFKPRDLRVTARPTDFVRAPAMGAGYPQTIRDDWTFELRQMWGPRIIDVAAPPGWALKAVKLAGLDVTDKPIDFERDNVGRLQIVLTNQVTEVSGVVTEEGKPVRNAAVIVFASDRARWDFQSRFLRLATTDENGRYRIAGLPPDEYRAIALARVRTGAGWQRPAFLDPLFRDSSRVTLGAGEKATLDLKIVKPR
jgi:protocatechuate 3,4-dioxygenase beta subunit